ncbi:MAG: hypothetical protein H0X25_11065 [Acidobacteriales bacterium]|nr:hypothetical protein [Terriglobales bacterium]
MKLRLALALILLLTAGVAFAAGPAANVPKYDRATEATFSGTVDQVKDRECPMSGGMGSHVMLKLTDGSTIEVHLGPTKFVKTYDLVFKAGDQLRVIGSKVTFEGVPTIFAREVHRGEDMFVFRDQAGNPVW